MNGLPLATPQELGFAPDRLQRAYTLLDGWVRSDKLPSVGVCVGRRGRMLEPRLVGWQVPGGQIPIREDALFLVASLSKPVTVTALMMLVERGLVALDDRVATYVPQFGQNGKGEVRLRHLMTHTSGLPDMLPQNDALRAAHRPLAAFIEGTCSVALDFVPGTRVQYQSMGTAMIAEVVHQVTGQTLAEFLQREVFGPLGMQDTSLGCQGERQARVAAVRITEAQAQTDWHWNTPYWLGFGAPWGGLITTPADFARFCALMLQGGTLQGVQLLSPATVRAMTSNQLVAMAAIPEEDRRCRPWGLGWRLNWPGHSSNFGDLLGPRSYGHWGATGTLCWLDPDTEVFCVLFTTQPQEPDGRYLARWSNALAAAS